MRGSPQHPSPDGGIEPIDGPDEMLERGSQFEVVTDRGPAERDGNGGGFETGEVASMALRSEPASVGLARRFVRSWLGAAATSPLGEDLQLVASELVTNAVRHSVLSALRLSRRERCVRLEVDDEGGGVPTPPTRPEPTAASGRGLLIVERVVTRWGWKRLPGGGKRVWCELCTTSSRV